MNINPEQLRTILWLRARLSFNQFTRGRRLDALLAVLVVVIALTVALAGAVTGALFGAGYLSTASPDSLFMAWELLMGGFLVFWLIGLLLVVQRSEAIDLMRLLHLPVSLGSVFAMNYAASHVTPAIILFLPGMLGVCAGLVWGRGWPMLLLVPLVFSSLFTITAWTYYLRGWLIALMVNPRRRRTIIMVLTSGTLLLSQAPNIYLHLFPPAKGQPRQSTRTFNRIPPTLLWTQRFLPPLWIPEAAKALASGRIAPALLSSAGGFLLASLGLICAYRSTLRFYRGAGKPVPAAPLPGAGAEVPRRRRDWMDLSLPGLPEQVTALALASFRNSVRGPELKMALAGNIVTLIFLVLLFFPKGQPASAGWNSLFVPAAATAFALMSLLQLAFNQFGFDRQGFIALVLLPIPRRRVFLGKNLGLLPFSFLLGLIALSATALVFRLGLATILAGCLQFMSGVVLLSLWGNLVSLLAPFRIESGSLKPTKIRWKTSLLVMLATLGLPFVLAPILLAPAAALLADWLDWGPVGLINVGTSFAILILSCGAYAIALPWLEALFEEREQRILQIVTETVE